MTAAAPLPRTLAVADLDEHLCITEALKLIPMLSTLTAHAQAVCRLQALPRKIELAVAELVESLDAAVKDCAIADAVEHWNAGAPVRERVEQRGAHRRLTADQAANFRAAE